MTLTLQELAPLADLPAAALQSVPTDDLSLGAQVIVEAFRTGMKPKPDKGWYFFYPVTGKDTVQDYGYHDYFEANHRVRTSLGRVKTLVEEIIVACQPIEAGGPSVDAEWLSRVLKPKKHKPNERQSPAYMQQKVLDAIDDYKDKNGGNSPLNIELAELTGYAETTVVRYLVKLQKAGEIELRSGLRNLVRLKGRWSVNGRN